jgi:carbamoyl-phosphate synthase large subunit
LVDDRRISVLIAGIGAGSLGLEIFKSLRQAGAYRLIGTDISARAYGLYGEDFDRTYLLRRAPEREYVNQLVEVCARENVRALAPGAEEVHRLLAANRGRFARQSILLMLNTPEVIAACSDKSRTIAFLKQHHIPVPETAIAGSEDAISGFNRYPCVVKPAAMSGGSNLVFIAEDEREAKFFVGYLKRRGFQSLLQEYVDSTDEFTVGVLSAPTGELLGSIAMHRSLENKLSFSLRYGDRVISSGWSQGRIDVFPEVTSQAERIATALNSRWALNIQGRLGADGVFYPFEVNPRHSGTTYLRALAGFNEPHILLQRCLNERILPHPPLRVGYYLRGFTEKYVSPEQMTSHDQVTPHD